MSIRIADVYFMRLLFRMPAVPKNDKPVKASRGSGDAVFGSSAGGSAAATCSGSGAMDPVRCTVATLVAEPPQIFVAVILYVWVSSIGPGLFFSGDRKS